MAKPKYSEGATLKDKKSFAKFLSEDEELVVAAGFGRNYIRHRFLYYIFLPGGIFILIGLGWAYFTKDNLGFGLLYGLIAAIIAAFLKTLWTYHSHRYLLTTRRVIVKDGYFSVKLASALYDKITHLEVVQSFLDRIIMKHGSIIIHTAGSTKDELVLNNIDSPIEYKNLLERLINREREQFGRPTGSVVTLEGELVEDKN